MNSVGESGDKKSYRVILLLIVGLTAFSSAMKELNQLREFTRETSNLVANWSNMVAPAPAPQVVAPAQIPETGAKVEVCESSLKAAAQIDQLGGGVTPAEVKNKDVGKTVVAERSRRRDAAQVAELRSHRSGDIEMVELRKQARREADLKLMILADDDGKAGIAIPSDTEFKLPKVKTHWQILVRPGERELLKSLNRSFNLRSAG
jgi:hypothetical protein